MFRIPGSLKRRVTESALPRGYLAGLQLSNNGTDGDHDIDIAVGEARDSADAVDIKLSSALTKRIDATWTAGTGNGGLSSSLSAPGNNTWYHVHAILVGGSADVGFDTSITAANLVADHSATAYRRIGSIRTDGNANIQAFVQDGDHFEWSVPTLEVNVSDQSTTAVARTLKVPTGLSVLAEFNFRVGHASSARVWLRNPSVTDAAPSIMAAPLASGQSNSDNDFKKTTARTNTSGQIQSRSDASATTLIISTLGWFDTRGRDD